MREYCTIVTNILTPYRLPLFDALARHFNSHGWGFRVLLLTRDEDRRPWRYSDLNPQFEHKILKGKEIRHNGISYFVNPSILGELHRHTGLAILGGYSHPSYWLALMAPFRNLRRLLWVESHAQSIVRTGRIATATRAFAIAHADAIVVPGDRTRQYVDSISPTQTQYFTLPNTIDQKPFQWHAHGQSFPPPGQRVFGSVCRLSKEKGVEELISVATAGGYRLRLLGDGPLRANLVRRVERNDLVEILEPGDQLAVARFLSEIDVFVLNSRRDPWPLAPVEAIAVGLPLALSSACGNAEEVVAGGNGLVYRQGDAAGLRGALDQLQSVPASNLREMAGASARLFEERFSVEGTAARFVMQLLAAYS